MYSVNANIIIEPKDIWEYFKEHHIALMHDMVIVAENNDFDVVIYLTNEENKPCLVIESSNVESTEFCVENEDNCEAVVQEVYNLYLTDRIMTVIAEEVEEISQEDVIDERELDLDSFVMRFLEDVLDENPILYTDIINDVAQDCKEHFLEYLYRKHGLSVYRPMELEDENEEIFFEDYPYECMEFDPSPLYKEE